MLKPCTGHRPTQSTKGEVSPGALQIGSTEYGFSVRFKAMGSPCEVLIESDAESDARSIGQMVAKEAWRIEDKFSRYVERNIVAQINTAAGDPTAVDEETANLLNFGQVMHDLSDGAFDITSGVLRDVWTFDSSDNIPAAADVARILRRVGWRKVDWTGATLRMESRMEIDLGGLGKEYAVDRATESARAASNIPCLINFGGDLAVTGAPRHRAAWSVAIEGRDPDGAAAIIALQRGALATSGDARRFLCKDGIRYGHVLDPRTGWPVINAARSVTVAADTCTQAGMLSTLALLKGADAEQFLQDQVEESWCWR